ncbi:helix-turn-helix domain-containing protein [Flavobacterium sp. LC2016-23]|nr:helix-turn-helix domain-containing protein [Flavobacterium sp. LC2016-23]
MYFSAFINCEFIIVNSSKLKLHSLIFYKFYFTIIIYLCKLSLIFVRKKMLLENLRKIRIIKGFSQDYVADLLNISQAAYSDIERGKTKINFEKLKKIAAIFDLEVSSIIDFHETQKLDKLVADRVNTNPDEMKTIIDHFDKERQLYQEQIDILKNEITYLRNKLDKK